MRACRIVDRATVDRTMKLREILPPDAGIRRTPCRSRRRRGDRGQPDGQTRRCVRRHCRRQDRRPALRRRRRSPPARPRSWPNGCRQAPLPGMVAFVRVRNARRALALDRRPNSFRASRASSPPSPAPAAKPRSRPSPGRSGARSAIAPPASAPLASCRRAARLMARSRRRTRSRCIVRSTRSPATASPILRSKRPRTASTNTGSTAYASRRAASPISRAIISIIIRVSRRISPPSCGCSTRFARAGRRGGRSMSITTMPMR